MQTQTSTPSSSPSSQPVEPDLGHSRLVLGLGAGISVIAIVGATLWLRGGGGGETAPSVPASASGVTTPLLQLERVQADTSGIINVYLVRDEAQADVMRSMVNELNAIRAGQGLSPIFDEIVVAATNEEAEELAKALDYSNGIPASETRLIRIPVDLRSN